MKNKEIVHGQTPETFYRVSVKAILRNDKGEMLAIKEGDHEPLWELPGGGLDHGETTLEGLKRELAEELGIENELTATIASITSEYYPLKDYWKLFVTHDVTIVGDYEIKMRDANEMKWMPVAEYNKSKHPVEPAVDEARKLKTIVISGSLRFTEQMIAEQYRLESEGNIVIGCTYMPVGLKKEDVSDGDWELFDEIHKRKIDMSDAVFVVNVGGYIGDSTRSEIEYAKQHGKEIIYLEKETK